MMASWRCLVTRTRIEKDDGDHDDGDNNECEDGDDGENNGYDDDGRNDDGCDDGQGVIRTMVKTIMMIDMPLGPTTVTMAR